MVAPRLERPGGQAKRSEGQAVFELGESRAERPLVAATGTGTGLHARGNGLTGFHARQSG